MAYVAAFADLEAILCLIQWCGYRPATAVSAIPPRVTDATPARCHSVSDVVAKLAHVAVQKVVEMKQPATYGGYCFTTCGRRFIESFHSIVYSFLDAVASQCDGVLVRSYAFAGFFVRYSLREAFLSYAIAGGSPHFCSGTFFRSPALRDCRRAVSY